MNKIFALTYLFTVSIVIFILFYVSKSIVEIFLIITFTILNGLAIYRAFKLENYLRKKDKLDSIGFLNHLGGVLNSSKKMKGLVIAIRPIFEKDDLIKERKTINTVTYLIYLIIILAVFLITILN